MIAPPGRTVERQNGPRKSPSTSARDQAQTRVQRFLRRINDHLAALDNDGFKRGFLDRQVNGWEARYSRFLATDGACEPVRDPADSVQAADFLLTIAALAKRRTALTRGYSMPPTKRHTDLHRAMLSLLVTADQRCPAIIGQAHLLYHADAERCASTPPRPSPSPNATPRICSRLSLPREAALRTTSPAPAP
jgi:hypothetical protein